MSRPGSVQAGFQFSMQASDGNARAGVLRTPRGEIETPCFMPVGTKGTVKGMRPKMLRDMGAGILLANTYHLAMRPGSDVVASLGGLHRFMGWDGPLLTDSGGFQVFSLGSTAKIDDQGVTFRSVYDGAREVFTPERAIQEQQALGADIIMCFDECPPGGASREAVAEAVRRTGLWGERCLAVHHEAAGCGTDGPQMLIGIVQGGVHADLRRESVERMLDLDFPGYAIGGLSVGEERRQMLDVTEDTAKRLPHDRVRYFMGIGDPGGLLEVIRRGVDIFDCVLPTRVARTGSAFVPEGRMNLKNAIHAESREPLDRDCPCTACSSFSRGTLRHLVMQKEILGLELLTEHNLTYLFRLVRGARRAIVENRFAEYARQETASHPW